MTHFYAADEADGRGDRDRNWLDCRRRSERLRQRESIRSGSMWATPPPLLAGRAGEIASLAARHGMKAMLRPALALYGLIPRFDPNFDSPSLRNLRRWRQRRAQLQPCAMEDRVWVCARIPAGAVVATTELSRHRAERLALLAVATPTV